MQPRTQRTVPLCQICCLQSLRRILCAPIHSKRSTDHLMPSNSVSWYQHPQKWQDASSCFMACFMALLFANGIIPMQTASQIDEQSNSPKLAPVKMRLPC